MSNEKPLTEKEKNVLQALLYYGLDSGLTKEAYDIASRLEKRFRDHEGEMVIWS